MGTVSAPQATDAEGNPIAATMAINGDSLELDVQHSGPQIAYPIAVTSAVTAATVIPGFNGGGAARPYTSYMQSKAERVFVDWCALNPSSGGWNQGAIGNVRDNVYNVQQAGMAPVVTFRTNAPEWTRPAIPGNNGTGCYETTYQASIPSGHAAEYGTAAAMLFHCLRDDVYCPGSPHDSRGNLVSAQPNVYGLEVGNEPNLVTWWDRDPSDGPCAGAQEPDCPGEGILQSDANVIYPHAVREAADKIHAFVPTFKVAAGGGINFNGDGDGGYYGNCWNSCERQAALPYMEAMLDGGVTQADALSIHPYAPKQHGDFDPGCGGYCEWYYTNAVATTRYRMHPTMPGKPIWVTEVGIDADYEDPPNVNSCHTQNHVNPCVTEQEEIRQANDLQYLWNTIRWSCEGFNVPLVLFWEAVDDAPYVNNGTPLFMSGFLKKTGGSPDPDKDAYQAFSSPQWVPFAGGGSQVWPRVLLANTCQG